MTQEQVLDGLKEVLTVLRPNTDLANVNNGTELVRELGNVCDNVLKQLA